MLDTLFEVFRVKTPDWFTQFVSGKRLTRKLYFYMHLRADRGKQSSGAQRS